MATLPFSSNGGLFVQTPTHDLSPWEKKDPGSGGHRSPQSTSFSAIIATLIPTLITAVAFVSLFLVFRLYYSNIYTPRTHVPAIPEKHQTPSTKKGRVDWLSEFWALDDQFLLRHHSLDGYLFLRFFKVIIAICLVGCCITFPILFPVNATGGGSATQLDIISFSNVTGKDRLYAHAVVAWLFLGFVMILVARERIFLIDLRDASLLSKSNAARISSRTILFLSVPKDALDESRVQMVFGDGVKNTWPVTDQDELETKVNERNESAMRLEVAEVQFARKVNERKLKSQSHGSANGNEVPPPADSRKDRPKHRSTPLIGKRVDAIDFARKAVSDLSNEVTNIRESQGDKRHAHFHAVFVEYENQTQAQKAYQQVRYHLPSHLEQRYIGVQPKELLWKNLRMPSAERISRGYVATAFVVATVILWSIPVGFVGAISNVNYLADKVKFLAFLKDLPDPILGLITGPLPPLIISTFVSYVPIFFRYVSKLSGEPTVPRAEIKTQTYYLIFQVVQIFLVTTFSSGAAAVVTQIIQDPTMIPNLLAMNLPKASNFYLSYFLIQGFASSTKNLLNITDLAFYLGYNMFIDKTPREKYNRYVNFKGIGWGSVYPKFTNMAIIAIAYSCIAPLVLGFAVIGLFLFYLSYRYNLFFVIQTKVDTKGECYGRALEQLLIGVYLSELCMIGLFGAREAPGPIVLMFLLFFVTIIYHTTMDRILHPIETYLPTDTPNEEEAHLIAAEEGAAADESLPAESRSRVFQYGQGRIPSSILKPLARFLEPHIFESPQALHSWLFENEADEDEEVPSYTEDEVKTAYLNPALTSKTPKLWLVRDDAGVSKQEIEENKKLGIDSTDEGAFLDEKNRIVWADKGLSEVPIFKRPKNL